MLARALFTFGLGGPHLARALSTFGLVASHLGRVFVNFGQGVVYFRLGWLDCRTFTTGLL